MSSKKTAKREVKSEGPMVTSEGPMVTPVKRKRGEDSDKDGSDGGDGKDDAHVRLTSGVKKEKTEVKSEMDEMAVKKRNRGNGDEDDDVKDAIGVHVGDVSVRKKKKKRKQAKRHACTEPGCGKDFASPSALFIHFRGHTGEKPFACAEPGCGMTFARKGSSAIHFRTHTGENHLCVQNQAVERLSHGGNI